MKDTPRLMPRIIDAAGRKWRSIDWHRPAARDGLMIVAALFVLYAVAHNFDLPKLFQFGADYAAWEVDDIIFVVFCMSVGLAVFAVRRSRDLGVEVKGRRAAEMEALKLARHDPLTGLPNRRFFVERLGELLLTTTAASRCAVLMLDLDGFKLINDGHGHAVGDQALIEFANRVSEVVRTGAILTRVGGDEFAVIVPEVGSLDDLTALARRISSAVAAPFLTDLAPTTLGVGIGIAIAPFDGTDPEVLVQRADRALYLAKAQGRSSIRFFEPEMDLHIERRLAMERELRAAIAENSIIPYYQPLIAFDGERVIGFEALARWNNPVLGWVPPDVFITLAEEIGVISQLGDQLLRQACGDAVTWPSELTLAFNISAIQLRDPTLGLRIVAILAETGLSPYRLELEITETALVENIAVAQEVIRHLRQAGIRIALDDFGTGYATLSQLLSFQLDRIKIDKSFVDRLGKDKESATVVSAILGLAKGFGLAATAEGIEDRDQLASLQATGCLVGQGYLFGKAIPAREVSNMLRKHVADVDHAA